MEVMSVGDATICINNDADGSSSGDGYYSNGSKNIGGRCDGGGSIMVVVVKTTGSGEWR